MASQQWHQAKTTASLKQTMLVEAPIVKKWSKTPEATALYPGLDGDFEYNPQSAIWETPPDCRHLAELLETSKELCPNLDLANATWDDVCEHVRGYIEDAQHTYEGKGKKSKVREMFRNGETVAIVAQRMVELFPDEFGLGTLRAGLLYIFQAWQTRIELTNQVLDALADILDLLVSAKKDVRILRRFDLSEEMGRLGKAVIEVIPKLVKVLNGAHQSKTREKPGGREPNLLTKGLAVVKRPFKPLPEFDQATVTATIDILSKAMKRWSEVKQSAGLETGESTYKEVKDIHKVVDKHTAEFTHLEENAAARHQDIRADIGQSHSNLSDQVQKLDEQLPDKLEQAIANYFGKLFSKPSALDPSIAVVLKLLHQTVADDRMNEDFSQLELSIAPRSLVAFPVAESAGATSGGQELAVQPQQATTMTIEQLIGLLDFIDPFEEVETIFRQARSISNHFLDRARWLMATPQFKDWLLSSSPSLLCVDGHATQTQCKGMTSPLSVILASLVRYLVDERSGIVLQFYCGHTNLLDESLSPNAMIRSLIAQLLLFPKPSDLKLELLDPRAIEDIGLHRMEALCYCFEHLLRQLEPDTPVYIIIDGVSHFEATFIGDLRLFMKSIRQWSEASGPDCASGPRLKVLLGSANISHELTQHIDLSREHVSLSTGRALTSVQFSTRGLGYQESL